MRTQLSRSITTLIIVSLTTAIVTAKVYELPAITPADFNSPLNNVYLPMAIGDTYVYVAEEEDGIILNQITATTNTTIVMGITCTVIHDIEWIIIEELGITNVTEETDDWLAWDNYGNVWYFGEDTTEYLYDDDWNPIGTSSEGSWEAGVDGAMPGILMLAYPAQGLSYQQEYYEGEAEDMGRVLRTDASVSVEYGDFEYCLKTKEWTPLDRGAIEHKYYAPGVGLVFIEELGGGKTVHVELIDIL